MALTWEASICRCTSLGRMPCSPSRVWMRASVWSVWRSNAGLSGVRFWSWVSVCKVCSPRLAEGIALP